MYPISNRNVPIDQKEFKTLVLRDLEDKPKVVKIIKQTMKTKNIAAGGAAIEFIIEDYEKKMEDYEEKKKELAGERKEHQRTKSLYGSG